MVSPPTYRLREPAVPIAALNKAPRVWVVVGRVAVEGSGLVSTGEGRLVPSPTAAPAGRRLVPLNKNMLGPPTRLRPEVAEGVMPFVGAGIVAVVEDTLEIDQVDEVDGLKDSKSVVDDDTAALSDKVVVVGAVDEGVVDNEVLLDGKVLTELVDVNDGLDESEAV